jgi:hypothetical protein
MKINIFLSILTATIISWSSFVFAQEPLLVRDSRIKEFKGQYSAVIPFYQWYLNKYNLTKNDMLALDYPINTKYGVAKPFRQDKWGANKSDGRVKLSIRYGDKIPTYDVITIKDHEIKIKYTP